MQYLYILQSCKNKRYYIGCTGNLEARIKQHNRGENLSTKFGRPWNLVCFKKFDSKEKAFREEKAIKSYKGGNAFKEIINGGVSEWSNVPLC